MLYSRSIFLIYMISFFYTSNPHSSVFLRTKPLCGQVIKLDCGQFRPAGANTLLHVKHLCSVDIGEFLRATFDSAYIFFSFDSKITIACVPVVRICKQFR